MAACSDASRSVVGPEIPGAASGGGPADGGAPGWLAGTRLWVDPHSPAQRQADAWRSSRPSDAALMDRIAEQPQAIWLGDWIGADPAAETAALASSITAAGAVPVFVVYNIPLRDCGLYSRGGAESPAAYRRWIAEVARGIGTHRAVVIVEPDAVAAMDCLAAPDQSSRLELVRYAVRTLRSSGRVAVYVDAGNAGWHPPATMASRLKQAGMDGADGFAVNVSNFYTTAQSIAFGAELSRLTGGKHFVIDTSRNGRGPSTPYEWCNPAGRALGTPPTTRTGHPLVDAYLWIKRPGESDGECNGGPRAGAWWPEQALELARRSQG